MPDHLIPKTGIAQTTDLIAEHVALCAARCPRLDSMEPLWKRTNTLKPLAVGALALVAVLIGAWLYGSYRWNAGTQGLHARLDAARVPVRPRTIDFRELEGLPAPVGRYFRAVSRRGGRWRPGCACGTRVHSTWARAQTSGGLSSRIRRWSRSDQASTGTGASR